MSAQKSFDQIAQEMMRAYYAEDYEGALKISERACVDFPEKIERPLIWRICLLSRLNRTDKSIRLLAESLDAGYWWPRSLFDDEDLDNVRELPEFQRLIDISDDRRVKAMSEHKPERLVVESANGSEKPYPVLLTMHGMGHNAKDEIDFWKVASELGWLVVSLQSSQIYTMDGFCWDDLNKAETEVLEHLKAILSEYPIDEKRIVLGGFSQGAGLAILSALSKDILAAGFIGIGTWAPEVEPIAERAQAKQSVRGYFVVGEKDHTLERAGEIQAALTEAGLELASETHPDLGHEFPPDYGETLRRALRFITSNGA